MRFKLIKKSNNSSKTKVRYCKKCKHELPSNYRGFYCPNCKGKHAGNLRGGLLAAGLAVFSINKVKDKIPKVIELAQTFTNIKL